MRLVVRVAGRKKGGALKYKTRNWYTAVPGYSYTRYEAHSSSFGKLGLDEESVEGPHRFLPLAIVLDPAGQRFKLPGGPSVELRRAS